MARVRVALAQTSSRIGDVPSNAEKHLRLIQEAASEGADLVVFPELSLTGYVLKDLAYEVAGPCREAVRRLAKEGDGVISVVGFVEEVRDGVLRNSAAVIGGGRLVATIPKFYLPTYGLFEEGRYFAAGDPLKDLRVIDTPFGRIGVTICEDLWHPEPAEALVRMGAELLICIASSPVRGVGQGTDGEPWIARAWRSIIEATALMNTVHVVFVNRVGPEDEEYFWGGSMVVGPDGSVLFKAPLFEEGLFFCELDLWENARARRFSSFRVHQRDFHRLLSEL
jgi:predicted amidohydrolase